MKKYIISLVISACALACTHQTSQSQHMILDDAINTSYQHIEQSAVKPRASLAFSNGSAATNCQEYAQLIKEATLNEDINNQLVKSEYIECDALALISSARQYTGVQPQKIGEQLLNQLDLRTFQNSLNMMTDDNAYTLSQLFPNDAIASMLMAQVDNVDLAYTLKVVAIINANTNDQPDWVVQLTDESKTGNYRNYATLIIYDPKSSGALIAEPIQQTEP